MTRKQIAEWQWFLVIIAAFFALNCFSIHTGDDLGYMFTDSTHHNGDGVRVTEFAQCVSTQCNHYFTTNGRFAVHVVVMAMLNLVPLWAYRLLNSLMFGLLWLLACRLAEPHKSKRTNTLRAVAWLLLFVALPQPGLVLLTLVSYSVNYLWVGVAVLAMLLALQRRPRAWWLVPYALFVGTLQESYSLPLCAGLFIGAVLERVPWKVTLAFIVGSAVEVFAPGNMAHAAQGGGFTIDAISTKLSALGTDLCYSIITPAAVALAMWFVVRYRSCTAYCRENIVLITAVIAALALAALTFTSPRQLTAPTLFVIVLALQRVREAKWLTVASVAVVVAVTLVMAFFKYQIHDRYSSFERSVASGKSYAYAEGNAVIEGNASLPRAFVPDPLCNRGLVAVGDKYTKQGLTRLRGGEKLNTILPLSPKRIARQVKESGDSAAVTTYEVSGFTMFAVPVGCNVNFRGPYECFRHEGIVYYVMTAPSEVRVIR